MSVPVCVCDVADEGPAADREDGEGRDQLPDQTGLHRQGLHLPGTHAHRKLVWLLNPSPSSKRKGNSLAEPARN